MSYRHPTGARPLAELVTALMTPACRKRGIANAALMLDPVDVFGERFASTATVERILWPKGSRIDGAADANTGATLVVSADAATALALSHIAPQIVERVNILIGWPAVARLRVTQTTARSRRRQRTAPAPPPSPREIPQSVAASVSTVDDPDLKAALARLGAGIARRGSKGGAEAP